MSNACLNRVSGSCSPRSGQYRARSVNRHRCLPYPRTVGVGRLPTEVGEQYQYGLGRAERAARRWRDLSAREGGSVREPDEVRCLLADRRATPAGIHRCGAATPPSTFGARRAASRRQPPAPTHVGSRRHVSASPRILQGVNQLTEPPRPNAQQDHRCEERGHRAERRVSPIPGPIIV
jgi:hypothetical protein